MQPGTPPHPSHPWNAYRAHWHRMPYRARGSPLIQLALFGAGSYFIAKWVVRNELSHEGTRQHSPQQQIRCSDCNNKIESARDTKSAQ